MKLSHSLFLLMLLRFCFPAIAQGDVEGKITVGYQGWFNCYNDGSPVDSWRHWSPGVYNSNAGLPAPGNVTFELYPDVSAYPQEALHETNLGNLANGAPGELFSSWPEEVIDLHFSWMAQEGIDGVALQRFIVETTDGIFKEQRDSIAARVQRAAEKYDRTFYIMYDISGMTDSQVVYLKEDWEDVFEEGLQITDSPAYARQDDKPVICLWGPGFTHIPVGKTATQELIQFFKDKGYYVIGGTPTYWLEGINDSKPDYLEVYESLDMISPWTIGRYTNIAQADLHLEEMIITDQAHCIANDIDYLPVIFPGFAWSNWNGGSENEITRIQGQFFWRQAYNVHTAGISQLYIAMFDEYDEATAIAPAADSYLLTPPSQYFLTTSADGKYCSPDFYLRVAGEIGNMIRMEDPAEEELVIPASEGPVYFRSSFEPGYDALLEWENTIDESTILTNVSGDGVGNTPTCMLSTNVAKTGDVAMQVKGEDLSDIASYCYFKILDVNIPVEEEMTLSFDFLPMNDLSRHISIDLLMTDLSTLRDSEAIDNFGNNMHPGSGRGTPEEWTTIVCNIGEWLSGKTIDRILFAFDYNPETGPFEAYVDNLQINMDSPIASASEPESSIIENGLTVYPNPVKDNVVKISISNHHFKRGMALHVVDMFGKVWHTSRLMQSSSTIAMPTLPVGVYTICYHTSSGIMSQKMIIL